MLRSNTINYVRQLISLVSSYDHVPRSAITKGFLMLGGATDLQKGKAGWFAGDLSGILAKKRPFWFQTFYKPGGRIAAIKDWNQKLNEIVEHAHEWDIGYIVGVPAWCQMCMEMVIEHYKVKNIHESVAQLFGFLYMVAWHLNLIKKDLKNYWANPLFILKIIYPAKGLSAISTARMQKECN